MQALDIGSKSEEPSLRFARRTLLIVSLLALILGCVTWASLEQLDVSRSKAVESSFLESERFNALSVRGTRSHRTVSLYLT